MAMALTFAITFEIMAMTKNTIVTAFPKASAFFIIIILSLLQLATTSKTPHILLEYVHIQTNRSKSKLGLGLLRTAPTKRAAGEGSIY